MLAWSNFCKLTDREKSEIGRAMINIVKPDLIKYVMSVLDDTIIREVEKAVIEFHTNRGEIFKYSFNTIEEAVDFLTNFENDFDETQFISIFQQ